MSAANNTDEQRWALAFVYCAQSRVRLEPSPRDKWLLRAWHPGHNDERPQRPTIRQRVIAVRSALEQKRRNDADWRAWREYEQRTATR